MSATLEECAQACLSDDACISFTRETVGTGPGPCTRSISCTHAVAKKEAEIYLTQRGMAVSDSPFPGKSLYEKGSVRAGPMPLTYYADRLALAANYPTKIITEKKYVTAPISQGLSAATADPEPISSTKSAEYLAAEHPPYCVTVVLNRYNAADGLTLPSKGTTTLKVYGTTGNSMVTRGIPSPNDKPGAIVCTPAKDGVGVSDASRKVQDDTAAQSCQISVGEGETESELMLIRCLSQRWAECMGVRLYAQQEGGTNVYDTSLWPTDQQPWVGGASECFLTYCNRYPDLMRAFCGGGRCSSLVHAQSCQNHWQNYGEREGRNLDDGGVRTCPPPEGYPTAKPVWTRFVSPPSPPPLAPVFSMFIDGFGATGRLALSAAECEAQRTSPLFPQGWFPDKYGATPGLNPSGGSSPTEQRLPYGCQWYVDPADSSYNRILFNNARKPSGWHPDLPMQRCREGVHQGMNMDKAACRAHARDPLQRRRLPDVDEWLHARRPQLSGCH